MEARVCEVHTARGGKCEVAAPLTEAGHTDRSVCVWCTQRENEAKCKVAAPLTEAGHKTDRSACTWCTPREGANAMWLLLSRRQATRQERVCVVHIARGSKFNVAAPLTEI
jgi:hypothetical protein